MPTHIFTSQMLLDYINITIANNNWSICEVNIHISFSFDFPEEFHCKSTAHVWLALWHVILPIFIYFSCSKHHCLDLTPRYNTHSSIDCSIGFDWMTGHGASHTWSEDLRWNSSGKSKEELTWRCPQSGYGDVSFEAARHVDYIDFPQISASYQLWFKFTSASPSIYPKNFTVNLLLTCGLRRGLYCCQFSSVSLV
jgi:hypothetical protein